MKKFLMTALLSVLAFVPALAQRSLYIPYEWRNRTDTLIYKESDPDGKYTWSKTRSRESEHFIVYWDNKYGNTIPTNAPTTYRVDIDDLLEKAEGFYAMNVGRLAFCDEANSNVSKYKMLILMNHSNGWICYGGGYDDVIGALWLSPSTCKPVGHSVAHEVGHSFQYQVFADLKGCTGFRGAIGNGSTFWEQTAQWQANQSYPELKWDQSWWLFKQAHNYAMTHEWQRYQSYWWHYYLAEKYGIDIVGKLWRHDASKQIDPNEMLMHMMGWKAADLFREYFDYAMKMATLDLDIANIRQEAAPYIGTFRYDYISLGGTKHQVAYSSCPQSTGFNVIPLKVPAAGTEISTGFTSLKSKAELVEGDLAQYFNGDRFTGATAKTYNSVAAYSKRGFRLGYVAYMNDGSRQYFYDDEVYCTGGSVSKPLDATVGMTVPEGVSRLFLIVSPAPSVYVQHKWDENIANDDQWPYTVEFTNTNILGAANIAEGKALSDATLTYDVYFARKNDYAGTTVAIEGEAAAALGTAMQLPASKLASVMTTWATSGPKDGQAMFYAVNANGKISNTGSSANGYGHWFNAAGNRSDYGSGYLFSEFDPAALTFTIGQFPNKLTNNKDYTIRQAVKYVRGKETALVTFVFNIHVTTTRTGYELTSVETTADENAIAAPSEMTSAPAAVFNLMGQKTPALHRGINIVRQSDGRTRKVMIK